MRNSFGLDGGGESDAGNKPRGRQENRVGAGNKTVAYGGFREIKEIK